ncbi:MAG: serine--tRNA ligase, partial [Thermoanaerobaculia bacterium]
MLSRELLRSRPEEVRSLLAARGLEAALFDAWGRLDRERRQVLVELEELKRQRNEASKEIGRIKREGGDAAARLEEVGLLKGRIGVLEARISEVDSELGELELGLPNLPHESVPRG